jgi:hypothetical protein
MPGGTGWSITSKATRMTPIRGGVIADAIGEFNDWPFLYACFVGAWL